MISILLSAIIAILLPAFVRGKVMHIIYAVFMPLLMLAQILYLMFFHDTDAIISLPYAVLISILTASHYLYFCIALCVLWLFAGLYSVFYITRNYHVGKLAKFMPFYNMAVCSALFVALAGNLVTTFVFYEILTFSTLPLVGFSGDEKSKKSLKKYAIILSFCALLFFLPSVLILQTTLDNTEFTPNVGTISSMFSQEITEPSFENYIYTPSSKLMVAILLLLIFGVAKNAIFPFNGWLPAAMCAPAPVSALLHAIAVVKSGAFITYKVIYEFFGMQYFTYLHTLYPLIFQAVTICAVTGIVVASIYALFSKDIKQILAYSTISGMTYIFLLFFLATEESMKVAFVQMIFHSVTKIGLFFIAGILYSLYHTNDYTKMAGAFARHKILFFSAAFLVFSMVGLPFTSGFFVKGMMFDVLLESKAYIALFGIVFSGIMSIIYLGRPLLYCMAPVQSHIFDKNITGMSYYAVMPIVVLGVIMVFAMMFFQL
jgi:multicomponent Na+:H+ antiporter subunit D